MDNIIVIVFFITLILLIYNSEMFKLRRNNKYLYLKVNELSTQKDLLEDMYKVLCKDTSINYRELIINYKCNHCVYMESLSVSSNYVIRKIGIKV